MSMAVTCLPHLPRLSCLLRRGSLSTPLLLTCPPRPWTFGPTAQLLQTRQTIHSSFSIWQLNSQTNLQAQNICLGFSGSMSSWLGPPGTCKYISLFLFRFHLSQILLFGCGFLLSAVLKQISLVFPITSSLLNPKASFPCGYLWLVFVFTHSLVSTFLAVILETAWLSAFPLPFLNIPFTILY